MRFNNNNINSASLFSLQLPRNGIEKYILTKSRLPKSESKLIRYLYVIDGDGSQEAEQRIDRKQKAFFLTADTSQSAQLDKTQQANNSEQKR